MSFRLIVSSVCLLAASGCATGAPPHALRVAVGGAAHAVHAATSAPASPDVPMVHYRWKNVQIVGGGFVPGIVFNPAGKGLLYARTDIGGCYRWDPRSRRWQPMTDWIDHADGNLYGGESIGVDPVDPRRVYLAAGMYTGSSQPNGEILRSDDGGRTFDRSKLPVQMGGNENGRSAGERLAVDPNDDRIVYFGSRNDGLWRSTDYGATWAKVDSYPIAGRTNGVGTVFVVFDRASGKRGAPTPVIYVGQSQRTPDTGAVPYDGPALPGPTALYRSADAGVSWSPVSGQPTGLMPHQAQISPDGFLYVTYGNSPGPNGMTNGAVWKMDTRTGTWSDITPARPNAGGNPGFGYAGLTIDRQHPQTVMVTTLDKWRPIDELYRSTDGGAHWAGLAARALLDDSASPYLDWGARPKFGWWMGALAVDPYNSSHVLFGTGATIWESDDVTAADRGAPTHWHVGARGIEETAILSLISPPTGAHLISGMGDIGGFRHDDLDAPPAGGMSSNPIFGNTSCLDFAQNRPSLVVRVGSQGQGHTGAYSQDGGKTWTPFPSLPSSRAGQGVVAVSADGHAIVWEPRGRDAACTKDLGATWTPCSGLPRDVDLVSDRVDPQRFYGFDEKSGMLYTSDDGGGTFTAAETGVHGRLVAAPGSKGDLWVASESEGLSHSADAGARFEHIGAVDEAYGIGFGKAAPGRANPALYLTGAIGAKSGVYRSDDAGVHWVRINDDQHQYGWIGWPVTGDPRVYGRVYMGTNGRGILYADPARR